ncbi:MAG: hypothetical protein NTV51_19315 [Verrucomicrobia bacterium]|nr:hypothetical protein [Verrucomicrobiota bacterium]
MSTGTDSKCGPAIRDRLDARKIIPAITAAHAQRRRESELDTLSATPEVVPTPAPPRQ